MYVSLMDKTNPMRILDRAGVVYSVHEYDATPEMTGTDIASLLGEDPDRCFKTLVTQGKSDRFYVFVIPVNRELDLKKAAAAVGEKSICMIRSKDLLSTTGYVHGGCSPLGMRKHLTTVFHETADKGERIYVSGGKVGVQVELDPADLRKVLDYRSADITR
ncbi:ybaK/ebsC protein [Thermoplasmatales archaeon BRNA1]|nr:ybaK/ebsC protein [Thermoplasmatales archaeon BRNA1]